MNRSIKMLQEEIEGIVKVIELININICELTNVVEQQQRRIKELEAMRIGGTNNENTL